jgi:hypothetical protein
VGQVGLVDRSGQLRALHPVAKLVPTRPESGLVAGSPQHQTAQFAPCWPATHFPRQKVASNGAEAPHAFAASTAASRVVEAGVG